MSPRISIIVPVYKVEAYLDRCIETILNQTYRNFELILVDDGSPDHCPSLCEEYKKKDKRVKVLHKENGGLSSARNAGIEVATGTYIGFVDSDDWIEYDMYEHLIHLIETHDADIVTGAVVRTHSMTDPFQQNETDEIIEYTREDYMKKFFKIGSQECVYYAWNKLYKRSIFDTVRYPDGLTCEDVLGTYWALTKSKKIVTSSRVVYHYFYNQEGITGKFSKQDFDLIPVWDRVVELAKQNNVTEEHYAILNRHRIDFTLLMRVALNESGGTLREQYGDQIQQCLTDLKRHKKELLSANIPKSRKLFIRMFCMNYQASITIMGWMRKWKK